LGTSNQKPLYPKFRTLPW